MAVRKVIVTTCDRCDTPVPSDPALNQVRLCVQEDSYRLCLCADCKRACVADLSIWTLYAQSEPAGHRLPPRSVDRHLVPIPKRVAPVPAAVGELPQPARPFLPDTGYARRKA
jgi:hypothetical protein